MRVVRHRDVVEMVEVAIGQCDPNRAVGVTSADPLATRDESNGVVEWRDEILQLGERRDVGEPSASFSTDRDSR